MGLTTQQEVRRTATFQPSTVNERERTVELVIATEAPIDGIILSCRSLPNYGPHPIPVLLGHQNHPDRMAGRIECLRIENRRLIGLARFIDAPAADEGWTLARSGCAVSVGASLDGGSLEPHSKTADIARDWRLREASLVPVPADPACLTRSHTTEPQEGEPMTTNTDHAAAAPVVEPSARELKRQATLTRAVHRAGLAPDFADELIGSDLSTDAAMVRIFERMRDGMSQSRAGAISGAPSRSEGAEVQDLILRRLRNERDALAMPEILERVTGQRGRPGELLQRAMSTSDFPTLYSGAAQRFLRETYEASPVGTRMIARRRQSADLRDISLLGLSDFPSLKLLRAGGEIEQGTFDDRGGSYRVEEYARMVHFTRRAILNDDLSAIQTAFETIGRAVALLEDSLAITALTTSTNGAAVLEDNVALFHANHANSTTATTLSVTSLAEATQKLRDMKAPGTNTRLNLAPRWLLVPSALEFLALQFTAEIQAVQASAVNPFGSGAPLELRVIVDANLTGTACYVCCDPSSPATALEICEGPASPMVETEADFERTGARTRVVADRGLAARDFRGICRIPG